MGFILLSQQPWAASAAALYWAKGSNWAMAQIAPKTGQKAENGGVESKKDAGDKAKENIFTKNFYKK